MTTDTLCPDRLILEQFLLGRLAEPGASRWEEHLSGCPRCVESLGRLEAECSFAAVVRNPGAAAPRPAGFQGEQEDGAVRGLIGQLKKLLPAAASAESMVAGVLGGQAPGLPDSPTG
jgi:anti-sigma factor RsiW